LDGSAVPRADIERMANVLKPYGPDRQEIVTHGHAAFVSCLHHLTPEDRFERQPLVVADRFVTLFDGRIDNREELGEALGIPERELPSMPESVLAFRLFERCGEGAFERILGVFTIIIADLQEGRLICARDHMGLRVLHYHLSKEHFAVATNPETLFALSWVPRVLNKDKVGDTLVQRGLNGETTYYQNIFRVLPGSIVRMHGSSFSKDRFWDPENIPDVRFKKDEDYVEAFQEHLDAAVRVRLRGRRPPCAMITGGLDSSSISVIAADMLAAEGSILHTFTAVPEADFVKEEIRGRYFDETPYVRQIAEKNSKILPHFIPPSDGPLLEKIAEQIRIGGAPSGGILNGLWVMDIVSAARSAGHEVMLSGDMGNLTMSHNGCSLFPQLLITGRWWRLLDEIISSGYRWKRMIRTCTIAPFIPTPVWRRYKQWRRGDRPPWHYYSAIKPEFAAQSGVIDRAAHEYLPFDAPPPRDGRLARIELLHCYSEAADWFAKLRATYGIDIRTPAFDRRLVEFCIGIPEEQYLRKGRDRWLIKRSMHGRLPNSILANKNRGVQSADWFPRLTRERAKIAAELKRLAKNPDIESIIDLQNLTAIVENWPEREPPEYSQGSYPLFWSLPQALGSAYFIENVTGVNIGR
jgi:asparagine synthase (glutamine-hydrolysing)